jgi:beta-glucanase (GH16 family)
MNNYEPFTWSGYEWIPQQKWGICHPHFPISWNDPQQVNIDENNILHLTNQYKRKYINETIGYSHVAIGLISTLDDQMFGYGTYEIEAKLPSGQYIWPAFWLWSETGWPPEIDVFEGYTKKNNYVYNKNYWEWILGRFWKMESNLHIKDEDGKHLPLKPKRSFYTFKNPSKHFIKYTLYWTPNQIEIYYNGILNNIIIDKNILKHFHDHKMKVIINNAVSFTTPLEPQMNVNKSSFQIKYFKYTPI